MPHTLFISDLHLSNDHEETMAAFMRFIREHAPHAERVYILGDLFEYWAGDDDRDDPFHAQVIAALAGLQQHQTELYILHGNRDLLMGKTLATACHAKLIGEPTLIDLYGMPTLLSHGDTLCTDDVEYQTFRKQVHDGKFQEDFLAQPLAARKAYIQKLRKDSDTAKSHKSMEIMDVNLDAVAQLLRHNHYPRLIHGHTHRPARHEHIVDDKTCERWVLGDWGKEGNALKCDAEGCSVLRF
ncbi:MAG: UDP-2,3-diacylglucosamine diphosphatase [Gallionella sp.]